MVSPLLWSTAATGFAVAFFHTALPTHWAPFALAARGRRWTRGKTFGVVGLAALAHVASTSVLGALVVFVGLKVDLFTGRLFPWLVGSALGAVGLFYLARQFRGESHVHLGPLSHQEHAKGGASAPSAPRLSDRATILGLIGLLALSPCEAFLLVYVSSIRASWGGFGLATLVLALATISGMTLFTAMALAGLGAARLGFLERWENGLLGATLCILAVAVIVLET